MQWVQWTVAVVCLWFGCWLAVGVIFDPRRCPVCHRRVPRRAWRAPKVWVPNQYRPAHRACVELSEDGLRELLRSKR